MSLKYEPSSEQADMNEDGCIEYREFVPAAVELIITLQTQKQVAMNKVGFKAHRLVYHSTLGSRVLKKKKTRSDRPASGQIALEQIGLDRVGQCPEDVPRRARQSSSSPSGPRQ